MVRVLTPSIFAICKRDNGLNARTTVPKTYAVRCGQKINPNYWPNYWPLCCLVYRVILKSIN